MSAMQTIGFVGVGKIGMPISQNLIKSGYRVVGYRRSSLEEFEKIGGVPARSAAEVGAQADVVFSCLPRRLKKSFKARKGSCTRRGRARS
jgi:3-hydroxyisobutyrate dehydrogenase-like beta-hydroxyacid dehydrogenase